jgi:hypothetical protein
MNKKIIAIIIAGIIIVIGVVGFILARSNNPTVSNTTGTTGTLPPIPTSTSAAETPSSTFIILGTSQGSVTTTNFYQNASYITPDGQTVEIAQSPSYSIVYNKGDSSFIISLLSTPLKAAQAAAEQAFLNDLGITQQSACKLNVNEGVPISVSDQYPGVNFSLSFCPGTTYQLL